MEIKNEGNENKIILEVFNFTMDEMIRNGVNKIQRLYRCCSNYALPKLIVDNGLEDLWRRENPDSPEFTCCDRSFGQNPGQTGSVLIYKLLTIPRLIKSWYPLLIIIILFLMTDSPQRLKQKKKIHGALTILFYVSPSSPKLQRLFFFLLETQNITTLQPVTGGNTPNLFLKRILIYSTNFTTLLVFH